jgi:hypothetical protein
MLTQQETIQRAMEFPMEYVTARYAEDQNLPVEVAQEHERELRRFLALCAAKGGYAMRGPVDEFWHTFIIFTHDYSQFCQQVAGEFIHHVPKTEAQGTEDPTKGGYWRFLKDYEEIFQEPPPAHIWPRTGTAEAEAAVCSYPCRSLACSPSCIAVPMPPPPR